MLRKSGVLFLVLFFIAGCGGAAGLLSSLNPFSGTYTGTLDYTSESSSEAITLNVDGTGHVTGSFTDPDLGNGSLSGTVDINGTVSGTTLNGATAGTFSLILVEQTSTHFTGNGTFTPNGTAKPVTIDVTKS